MKKMYFVITILVVGMVIWAVYDSSNRVLGENTEYLSNPKLRSEVEYGGNTVIKDELKKLNMVITSNPLDFSYTPNEASSLESTAKQKDLDIAVNGSYYVGSYVDSSHSGLLQIKGKLISEYVPNVQISHVVVYNHTKKSIVFVRAKELDLTEYENKKDFTLVQTGPIMIESGEIQEEFINGSLNGNSKALRTLLGYTDDGEIFMVVTRKLYDLKELSELILSEPRFKGKNISVINLDGGASTAMFAKEVKNLNFREATRLPMVIGIMSPQPEQSDPSTNSQDSSQDSWTSEPKDIKKPRPRTGEKDVD